jgi:hypothetical protein|tara:strand:- start:1148 stop:1510 length:363 start_codon:yes stop_codon:yes gene_type:complete
MQTLEQIGPKSIEWAAGLFEGEGTIYRVRSSKTPRWCIRIKMTDLDVLEDFHATVGRGNLNGPHHSPSMKPHHKPFWHWETNKKDDVITVLSSLKPFLGYRRSKLVNSCLQDYGVDYATD